MGRYVNQSFSWILGPLQLVPNKNLQKKIRLLPHISFACEKTRKFSLFRKISLQSDSWRNAKFSRNRKWKNSAKKCEIWKIHYFCANSSKRQNTESRNLFSRNFASFRIFRFIHFREKVGDMRTKFSHFFPETSRSLQTLLLTNKYSLL